MLKHSLIAAALVALSGCDPQSPSKEAPKVSATPAPESPNPGDWRAEVRFAFDSAELNGDGRKLLDELARKTLAADFERLVATAHSDRIGDAAYNDDLAERRAEVVRDYLVEKGVPEDKVDVKSRGAREPITARRCEAMGPETKQNAKLIACLQPDRRAEIVVKQRAAR